MFHHDPVIKASHIGFGQDVEIAEANTRSAVLLEASPPITTVAKPVSPVRRLLSVVSLVRTWGTPDPSMLRAR